MGGWVGEYNLTSRWVVEQVGRWKERERISLLSLPTRGGVVIATQAPFLHQLVGPV